MQTVVAAASQAGHVSHTGLRRSKARPLLSRFSAETCCKGMIPAPNTVSPHPSALSPPVSLFNGWTARCRPTPRKGEAHSAALSS